MSNHESDPEVSTEPVDPSAPGLRWAIKRSFVDYVFRMPDGGGWVTDGATADGDNVIHFEFVGADVAADGAEQWRFRGNVRFGGHGGLLFVQVLDPVVTVRHGRATLSVVEPSDESGEQTLDLVTLTLTRQQEGADGCVVWSGDPVELTAAGVPVFNDVYAEGTLFEPMHICLPVVGS